MKSNFKLIIRSIVCGIPLLILTGCFQQTMTAMNSIGSSLGVSTPDIDAFIAKEQNFENQIGKIADSLFKAMASDEEIAKMNEMKKRLNETTDDKEKFALRQQITESELATIEKRAKDSELQQQAKNWDARKKKHVSDSWYNFSLSILQGTVLVLEGTNLVNTYTMRANKDPVGTGIILTFKLPAVTVALKSMVGILDNMRTTGRALFTFMSEAQINAKAPTSAAEKPREIEGGI